MSDENGVLHSIWGTMIATDSSTPSIYKYVPLSCLDGHRWSNPLLTFNRSVICLKCGLHRQQEARRNFLRRALVAVIRCVGGGANG